MSGSELNLKKQDRFTVVLPFSLRFTSRILRETKFSQDHQVLSHTLSILYRACTRFLSILKVLLFGKKLTSPKKPYEAVRL